MGNGVFSVVRPIFSGFYGTFLAHYMLRLVSANSAFFRQICFEMTLYVVFAAPQKQDVVP